MPDSNEVSTTTTDADDLLIGTDPIVYNPAIHASILRSIGRVENELFASGLTKPQQKLLGRIREYRTILWRMIPEGY